MSVNKLVQKRFDELTDAAKTIDESVKSEPGAYGGINRFVDPQLFLKWTVQVKDLISRVCNANSVHYQEFVEAEKVKFMESSHEIFKRLNMVFEAAKEDCQAGYFSFDSEFDPS